MPYKEFNEVEIGDIATDYGNHQYPVIGKGTLKEMFEKFRDRTPFSLGDFLESAEGLDVDENSKAIAVQDEPHFQGDVGIYLYDLDGAVVMI